MPPTGPACPHQKYSAARVPYNEEQKEEGGPKTALSETNCGWLEQ